MPEVEIKIGNPDECIAHIGEIDTLVKALLGQDASLSIDSEGVRLHLPTDTKVPDELVAEAVEAILNFNPAERPAEPTAPEEPTPEFTKQELAAQLNTMQKQIDALREAIDKLSDKRE